MPPPRGTSSGLVSPEEEKEEEVEDMMRDWRSWWMQELDTTTSGELHAPWDPKELALYFEPATTWTSFSLETIHLSCGNKVDLIFGPRNHADTMG